MKKGRYYYEKMLPIERIKFSNSFRLLRKDVSLEYYLDKSSYFDFEDFLGGSFNWEDSKEGYDYWNGIYNKYE